MLEARDKKFSFKKRFLQQQVIMGNIAGLYPDCCTGGSSNEQEMNTEASKSKLSSSQSNKNDKKSISESNTNQLETNDDNKNDETDRKDTDYPNQQLLTEEPKKDLKEEIIEKNSNN